MATRSKKSNTSTSSSKLTLACRSPKTGLIIGYLNVLNDKAAEALLSQPELAQRLTFEVYVSGEGGKAAEEQF